MTGAAFTVAQGPAFTVEDLQRMREEIAPTWDLRLSKHCPKDEAFRIRPTTPGDFRPILILHPEKWAELTK